MNGKLCFEEEFEKILVRKEKEVKDRGKGIARQRSCVHMVIWIAMHSAKN